MGKNSNNILMKTIPERLLVVGLFKLLVNSKVLSG